jgi:hypothetical protein
VNILRRGISPSAIDPAVVLLLALGLMATTQRKACVAPRPVFIVGRVKSHELVLFLNICRFYRLGKYCLFQIQSS